MPMHFISGLPRSGTTLLASLLRQNPNFEASFQSPLAMAVTAAVTNMGPENEGHTLISDAQRRDVVRGMFTGFYDLELLKPHQIVFDNSRRWCANMGIIADVFPEGVVLCCVRPIAEIVDSFERLFQSHQIEPSRIHGGAANVNVYARVRALLDENAVVGWSLAATREAFYGVHWARLHLIEYSELCNNTAAVLESIHKRLGAKPFQYDFRDIRQLDGKELFDAQLGTPGLHTLFPEVAAYKPGEFIIPPDIVAGMPAPFWR